MRLSYLLPVALIAGCSSCGGAPQATPQAAEPGPERGAAVALATVEGVVRLAPGAELPSDPVEPVGNQPAPPDICTPPQVADRQPVRLGEGRGLGGVLVAAAEFDADVPHEPTVHHVTIRDCRLSPRLVTAMRGDSVEVTNETDYPFLPTLGPGIMQPIMRGESRTFVLDQGGVAALRCGFAAPCGRTDVIVLYHPVHTITGPDGRFQITNAPAGVNLQIHAWHPLLAEATTTVRSDASQSVQVTLELTPSTPRPADAPETEMAEPGEGPL